MLFITNRVFNEGNHSPEDGTTRKVTFDLKDNNALQSLFFCRRRGPGDYEEIRGVPFLDELSHSKAEQILILIHGFANFPEDLIFQRAERLQQLFDARRKDMIQVIPLVWPCRDTQFNASPKVVGNYFEDQHAADASAFAYARALMFLVEWQNKNIQDDNPCLKRVNVLAHSMGNRVFTEACRHFSQSLLRQEPPMMLRHSFLVAADVINEIFEPEKPGRYISIASATVTSYYASDDMALRSSKVTNVANGIASRRLGHTGPEDMDAVPKNVFGIDCGAFNSEYDRFGHTYFLTVDDTKPKSKPGECFNHIADTIESGMIPGVSLNDPRLVRLAKTIIGARKKAAKKTS